MRDFEQKLQASLKSFVEDIEALLRRAALDALEDVLGEQAVRPIGERIAPSRSPASRTSVAATRGAGGLKRSAEHLAELTRALDAFIRKHRGLGVEAIAKQMGASTKDLALPIKKLLAERRIAARGVKRATRYYPR